MCTMLAFGPAPCQCFSPGAIQTVSPGRISRIGAPQTCTRPTPETTCRVWPSGWVCQAVRAFGSKRTPVHAKAPGAGGQGAQGVDVHEGGSSARCELLLSSVLASIDAR